MRHIEECTPLFGCSQLHDDRTRDHIARRQFLERMVAIHKSLAAFVSEIRAFTAKRFTQQEPRRALKEKRSGMELNEFDVGDLGSGAKRSSDAISSCYIRIRRVLENAAEPTRGKQDPARLDDNGGSRGAVICCDSNRFPVVHE